MLLRILTASLLSASLEAQKIGRGLCQVVQQDYQLSMSDNEGKFVFTEHPVMPTIMFGSTTKISQTFILSSLYKTL